MRIIGLLLSLCCVADLSAQSLFTSGGKLKPEQAIMDVRHYTIALDINVADQSISGYTIIDINMLQPTRVLLFDLLDSFHIKSITVNNQKQSFDYSHNLITINLAKELPAGKASVKVEYKGKPHVAIRPPWDDGFTWVKDSTGHPWIAVTAEGTGGKLYYPCKDHPSDEPNEGADLIITVPKDLVVAGPGLLQKITKKKDKATYHWKTNYTINNYSLVFNIGDYKVVSKDYTTVNGKNVPMQFYVLQEHADKAAHLLEILEQSTRVQEKYFGEYPWIKEKIAIAETPHLGMEHQTMNAYGNKFRYVQIGGKDFDGLLHHELGHEWWGNKVTVNDWADFWIQEGICSYGDGLYTLEMEGESAYIKWFKNSALHFQNKKPIVLGKDIDEETAYHGDIYGKGAFFMHTLRYVLGDSLFFPTLKQLATDTRYSYDNLVNTNDVESLFSKNAGIDLKPLFNLYLRTTNKLEIAVKRTGSAQYEISLMNLDMLVPLDIVTNNGMKKSMVDKKGITVNSSSLPVIDPDMFYLTKITFE